jgi:hypothetical protein
LVDLGVLGLPSAAASANLSDPALTKIQGGPVGARGSRRYRDASVGDATYILRSG